jgi:YesN/AraC family two-component response regulator
VLLSDFRMPEINGIDLIKKIKESNPFVRTILMTAFEINDELFKDYIKNEIINAFLQKPIS